MFVDDESYVRNGRTYRRILLRNSYRRGGKVYHDTIANLSRASDEEIRAISWALKNKDRLFTPTQGDGKITTKQGLSVGSVWMLSQLAKQTGISRILGQSKEGRLSLWMVIATVIGFRSRLSVVRAAQRYAACDVLGLEVFDEDDLYATLDWLARNQEVVEQKMFLRYYGAQIPKLFLYDVTSSYLEGQLNEYGQFGYNRDGKKRKKQILVGLLTDEEGWPIACEVFKGNTQDPGTVLNQIRKLAERFKVEKVTFVGDRGMIKNIQIGQINEKDFYYITAITKPQIRSLLEKELLNMSLFDEAVREVREGNVRYVLRRNPIRAQEIAANRERKWLYVTGLLVDQNRYLAEHGKANVAVALAKIVKKAKTLGIHGWIKVETQGRQLRAEKDLAAQVQEALLDGCYVIKTDLPLEQVDAGTIHQRYKDLAEVEWAFRTMKTAMLELRGIFVRKAQRTRAHVFVVMLAYMLVYQLRRAWANQELTVEEGIEELSQICGLEVFVSGQAACQSIPEPRERGKSLLKALKITLPEAIPFGGVTVVTRKKLVPERRNDLSP